MRYRTYICASLIVAVLTAGILIVPSGTAKTISADRATLFVVPFLTTIAGIAASPNSNSSDAGSFTDRSSGGNEAVCSGSERVWDGEGTTNNWSEAANWCNDQVPPSGAGVRFNSTSTKDLSIDVSVSTGAFIIESGYTGTISIAGTNTVTAGTNGSSFEQAGGTFNVGSGSFTQQFGSVSMNGGVFSGGSGVLNIPSMGMNGGTFDAGASTQNTTNIIMSGGHIVFTSGTMTITGSFFRSGGTGDFDNGTIVAGGGGNQSLEGIYGTVNNLTINKSDSVGINTIGTIAVLGTLTLTDGIYSGSGTLEARGTVSIASTFGNDSQGGGGGKIALRNGSGPRTVTLPAGVRMPELIVDDANVQVNTNGAGTINLDDLTINAGTVDLGPTNLIFGYTTAVQGSQYVQNGGSFNIDTGNIAWNTAGNFTLNSGTFNAGSGTVQLGGGQFSITGGTFTPSTGDNTFCSSLSSTFTQSGGLFAAGAGSVDVNGAFNLSGGTFNAPAGNMFVGFAFDQTAGTFNHNNGTLTFDSSHPSFTINLPGNPGTGQFHNLVFALTTDNAQIALNSDTWAASGNITIVNGRVANGVLRAEGNFTVEPGADGGTAEVRFAGTANQTYQNNGGVDPTRTFTVDKSAGVVTAASDMLLGATQALNIVAGTLFLANGSDLRSGNLTVGVNGRLVNYSSTTITLGGNVSNSGRIDLQGGGADCPGSDLILIRSTVNGTRRQWNGSGAFRIVDADIQDMAGTAAITAYSSTNSGNTGANWTFNSGCPAALSISPETVSLYRNQTQTFTAGGGFAPRTFSIVHNNSGASINASSGLYTAGNTMNVTDTVRVTDVFGATAEATVNVIPGPPTRLVFTVQPSNASAGQSISPSIQVAVQDNDGNTIPNATNAVTLNLLDNPGGSTLSGTVTRNAVNGIATFNNISLNKAANGYTLQASASGLTGAVSTAFNINPGAPAQLGFITQPSETIGYEQITPAIVIGIYDAFGNIVNTATNQITVAIGNNPASGTLDGIKVRSAVNGVAAFPGLSIDNFGNGYTLTATAAGLSAATSDGFNILSPFVVRNTNPSGPGSLRQAILRANQAPGQQTISFDIPDPNPALTSPIDLLPTKTRAGRVKEGTSPFIISPTDLLPALQDQTIIDGTTQPGYTGSPLIEIRGDSAPTGGGLGSYGLVIRASNVVVRGLAINGFRHGGILIFSPGLLVNVRISGNHIGLTADGNTVRPNGNWGIRVLVDAADNLVIGGDTAADRNVIGGHLDAGIFLSRFSRATIKGNYIGTRASGIVPAGNLHAGIVTEGAATIGGDLPGEGNLIAFNNGYGILLANSDVRRVRIRGNSIHSNVSRGIALNGVSPLENDSQDPDPGSNDRQNYPEIREALTDGPTIDIRGSLNSTPNRQYVVDLFSTDVCPSASDGGPGFGQGKNYLGSVNVNVGSSGISPFGALLQFPVGDQFVVATATDPDGNTSMFSRCVRVAPGPVSISGTVRNDHGQPIAGVGVRVTGSVSRAVMTDMDGNYNITRLPSGGSFAVTATHPNFGMTPPVRNYSNLVTSQTSQDFTATRGRFSVSGELSFTDSRGTRPLSGVSLVLSGTASRVIRADGRFVISDLQPGTYSLTPIKSGITFSPPFMEFTIVDTDFTADGFVGSAAATPPGRLLMFDNSSSRIRSIDADGTYTGLLADPVDAFPEKLSISRDGRQVIYARAVTAGGQPVRQIFRAGSDGSNEVQLTDSSTCSIPFEWSPDGSKILFGRCTNANTGLSEKVWMMNADGSNKQLLPLGSLRNRSSATWLDNDTIIVSGATTANGNVDLYRINIDGSDPLRLTNGPEEELDPAVSNAGTRVAYIVSTSHPSGIPQIDHKVLNISNGAVTSLLTSFGRSRPAWSPNDQWIALYRRNDRTNPSLNDLVAVRSDGSGSARSIYSSPTGFFSWGADISVTTQTGTNVSANGGFANVTFNGVTSSGTTTFTPISPSSAGTAPNGFIIGNIAFEITTTAAYSAPVTVCFVIPQSMNLSPVGFEQLSMLHNEGGVLIDRTTSRNFNTRTICGTVSTLSPFALAEAIDPALPSIEGVILDQDGLPMAEVPVNLTGDETKEVFTDENGRFSFVNLIEGGNYNVRPRRLGFVFSSYSLDLTEITGENNVFFTGTAASFSISGKVSDGAGIGVPNVTVNLNGPYESAAVTGADGSYSFDGVPADGLYDLTLDTNTSFSPDSIGVGPLIGDFDNADFSMFSPTAASVSIGGRVFAPDGQALRNAVVTATAPDGTVRTAVTGSFGYFRIEGLAAGSSYVVSVRSRRFRFDSVVINADSDREDLMFYGTD